MPEILKFDNYKVQEDEPKLGCLMLYFSFSNWKEFVRNMIPQEDIYTSNDEEDANDYGYEDEPHCTILYGFHHYEGIVQNIKEYLPKLEELTDVMRGDITIFEQDDYDVVKFDIHSDKLKELNNTMCFRFEYTNSHPDYHAHMTIAYVKKGKGVKYVKTKLKQVPLFGSKYIYSDHDYNKTNIVVE